MDSAPPAPTKQVGTPPLAKPLEAEGPSAADVDAVWTWTQAPGFRHFLDEGGLSAIQGKGVTVRV